jgi:NAD(P)-dependent dehydrogenase (short-subunit alcohol dehydrogenase family)
VSRQTDRTSTVNRSLQQFSVEGLRVVVTGASSGLGRHFATVLAVAGAEVFCCARRRDRLSSLVAKIQSVRGRARAVTLDVTDRRSVCAAFDDIGAFEVLVNNAGVAATKRLLDCNDEDWNNIVGTNLTGAWKVAQEAARRMIAAKIAGSIINITSILASRVAGGVSPYMAAKAGLKHLTQSMALELAPQGIRVNSIAPGYVATDLNRDFLGSDAGQRLLQRIPSRRFGTPADLDGALLLLASPASTYMNGSEIVVDGGHLCSSL